MKAIVKNKNTIKQQKKDFNQKLNMFDRLPDHCLTCNSTFDRKNKEQVQSWFVVVKNEEQKVRLYCPECWNKAQEIARDFFERQKDVSEDTNI